MPKHSAERNSFLRAPDALVLFLAVSAVLTLVSVVFSLLAGRHHLPWPYSSPLLPASSNFGDLLNFVRDMPHLGTPSFFSSGPRFAYPPAAILFYEALYRIRHQVTAYLLLAAIIILLENLWFARKMQRQGMTTAGSLSFTAAVTLLAFPLWFLVQRANIEIFVFLLCAAGAWMFLSGRRSLAGALWGFAAAVKLFPVFYLGLLCRRGSWRALAVSIASAAFATLCGLRLISPNILFAEKEIMIGLLDFKRDYTEAIQPLASITDHSLFNLLKQSAPSLVGEVKNLLSLFLLIVFVSCLCVWFFRLRDMPSENQVIFATAAMITFMPTSLEYTLVHVYTCFSIVVIAVLREHFRSRTISGAAVFLLLMAGLTVPLNWMVHRGTFFFAPFQSILLVALMVVTLRFPLPPLSNAQETAARPGTVAA